MPLPRLTPKHLLLLKVIIHLGALLPVSWTFYAAISGHIDGDPVDALLRITGIGALNLLVLSLLVSPLAKKLRQGLLIRVRRLIGIYAFTYALCHLITYILFELQLEWQLIASEIIKRPYITAGFATLLILMALASTSTQNMQKRLGKRWQQLHNWVYLAIILGCLHYWWSQKTAIGEPLVYWSLALILLWFRKDKLLRPFHLNKRTNIRTPQPKS